MTFALLSEGKRGVRGTVLPGILEQLACSGVLSSLRNR